MTEMAVMFAFARDQRLQPSRPEESIPVNSRHGDVLWTILKQCWAIDPESRPDATEVRDIVSSTLMPLAKHAAELTMHGGQVKTVTQLGLRQSTSLLILTSPPELPQMAVPAPSVLAGAHGSSRSPDTLVLLPTSSKSNDDCARLPVGGLTTDGGASRWNQRTPTPGDKQQQIGGPGNTGSGPVAGDRPHSRLTPMGSEHRAC